MKKIFYTIAFVLIGLNVATCKIEASTPSAKEKAPSKKDMGALDHFEAGWNKLSTGEQYAIIIFGVAVLCLVIYLDYIMPFLIKFWEGANSKKEEENKKSTKDYDDEDYGDDDEEEEDGDDE